MTKRSGNMRSFPNAWVLPGGHLDIGESLEEGILRELFEETGIKINKCNNLSIYLLYENASSFSLDS